MTPAQYHRILVALDVVLDAFDEPAVVLSPEEAKIQYELRVIRSKILKAESGHPFPFGGPETADQLDVTAPPFGTVSGEVSPTAARKIRILIVDDQESVRMVVRLLAE